MYYNLKARGFFILAIHRKPSLPYSTYLAHIPIKGYTEYIYALLSGVCLFVCFVALHPKSTAMDLSPRKYETGPGSNSRPFDLQSDSHLLPDMLPTALCDPVTQWCNFITRAHETLVLKAYA